MNNATPEKTESPLAVTFSCHGPQVIKPAADFSTGAYAKRATSPVFKVLVFTELTAEGVIFLGDNDPIHCTATISPGYKIVGGEIRIIPESVYTDWNSPSRGRPPVYALERYVNRRVNPIVHANQITFDFWILTNQFKGNFDFVLTVDFIDEALE